MTGSDSADNLKLVAALAYTQSRDIANKSHAQA